MHVAKQKKLKKAAACDSNHTENSGDGRSGRVVVGGWGVSQPSREDIRAVGPLGVTP